MRKMNLTASWCETLSTSGNARRGSATRSEQRASPPTLLPTALLRRGAAEKEPEGGHPTGFGRAIGSPKLPARGPTDPSAQRSPNEAEGRPQASEASVWVNDEDQRPATAE